MSALYRYVNELPPKWASLDPFYWGYVAQYLCVCAPVKPHVQILKIMKGRGPCPQHMSQNKTCPRSLGAADSSSRAEIALLRPTVTTGEGDKWCRFASRVFPTSCIAKVEENQTKALKRFRT